MTAPDRLLGWENLLHEVSSRADEFADKCAPGSRECWEWRQLATRCSNAAEAINDEYHDQFHEADARAAEAYARREMRCDAR